MKLKAAASDHQTPAQTRRRPLHRLLGWNFDPVQTMHLPKPFATRGTFLAQHVQPFDTTLTAGTSRLDPLANPDFFLRL
jgi:hypothetical protein